MLYKKLSVLCLIAAILLAGMFSVSLFFAADRFNQIDGTKSRQYYSLIQDGLSQNAEPEIEGVGYAVVSFDGKILKSTIEYYPINQTIELKLLAGIDQTKINNRVFFAAPFIKDNIQTGTLVLLIDEKLVRVGAAENIVWIFCLSLMFVTIVFFVFQTALIIKNEIAVPLNTLSRIAKKMAGGEYGEKLLYDYTDEIGQLCHDIEVLRDELLSAGKREAALKQNEKFLLACISHDLKTPLSVISGTAESLKDGIVVAGEAAETILAKASMLNKLIDDILEQTKTELGEFSINMFECYAKDFFETELKELQAEAEKKNLGFKMSACPDCIVSIDKRRMYQVMQNLTGNAIKYTHSGGTVSVSFEIRDNSLTVSVKDMGTGIPAKDLPFIFDKFFRGEKARNSTVPGSGLGLPIAKYIIEKHGGSLECDTLLGKGTEMRFSLPLNIKNE